MTDLVTTAPSRLTLTDEEESMLAGEAGEAVRLAMRILTRVAPLYGARRLLQVTRAHIDGCIYEGEAGLEFAERLAAAGGRFRVPTSLNVVSLDRTHWRELGLDTDYASKAYRLGQAYLTMGATPSFTCAPYQTESRPEFGEQIAWSESNAVAFANSVIGARTNRYGDYLDAACALTGRVPAAGLHLDDPRLATVLVQLRDIPSALMSDDTFYPVLGYLLGALAIEDVPVINGLDADPSEDQLKSLAAAAATSGSVAMFHVTGITPEAPTLDQALGGRAPARTIEISLDDLLRTRESLSSGGSGEQLGVVAFGSPHCSLAEGREISRLVAGKTAANGVEVFLTTSRAVRDLLSRSGDLDRLEAFGARVTADTCIVVSPLVKTTGRILMTNSAKYAHYGPGIVKNRAVFASTRACVESAVAGRVVLDDSAWQRP